MKSQKFAPSAVEGSKRMLYMFVFWICAFFASAGSVFADKAAPQTIPCVENMPCITETTQKSGKSMRDFIVDTFGVNFLKGFLGIVAVTAVIFIIVGGLQLLLAMGNEEAVKKAKSTLLWAILGLVIAILSASIVQIITNIPF